MGKGSSKAQGTRQDPWKGLEAEEHKTLGKATRRKGCSSKEPRKKTAGKASLNQETEKPQEVVPGEQQEGPVSSLTVPKEGEEGEQQPINHKDLLEEKKD